jgi:hypothetical protein
VLSDEGDIEQHFNDLLLELLQTLRDEQELIAALPKMQRETLAGHFVGKFLALLDIPTNDMIEMAIVPAFLAALVSVEMDAPMHRGGVTPPLPRT